MYKPILGLEVHIQLKTESKIFCKCKNDSDETRPNTNVCPVCLGHPGVLPVINKKAVEYVLKTSQALNCQISSFSKFDRKNYFYPDLPKGYQISQYDKPLSVNGYLKIDNRQIRIRRIHLEEDTGKLIHQGDKSLIDFNRAGIPLMEIVTEPDIRSAKEAKEFCQELQLILRYLDISKADMEKGEMRCEVNISLGKARKMGTKVEIKNLNSFRAVERAIEYEIERQNNILERDKKVAQETRGWNEKRQMTVSQRTKEEAHDYRYFPEPDLPALRLKEFKVVLPELPNDKRKRFIKEYKLPQDDVEVLVVNEDLANYFEKIISELTDKKLNKLAVNYLLNELPKLGHFKDSKITPENFAEFIALIDQGEISSSAAQQVLARMFVKGSDPSQIIDELNLRQVSDEKSLGPAIEKVIKNNSQAVRDFQQGKEMAIKFLIGQVMATTKGKADPQKTEELLRKELSH